MTTLRCLVVLALVLGHIVVSAQVVVPRDWKRLSGTPDPKSSMGACVQQGAGALFQVAFDRPRLTATVMPRREYRRDPAPYELDWAAALDDQPPPPPPPPPGPVAPVTQPSSPAPPRADQLAAPPRENPWATRYARERAMRLVVPVADGYLVGFGAGEYGGSLWWYPAEPGPGRKLAQAVVHAIVAVPASSTYIVLTGLAHLGIDEGSAFWVARDAQGRWQIDSNVALPGAPSEHAVTSDGLVMVGPSGTHVVTWTRELRTLHRTDLRTSLGSIAAGPSGEVAIGRGGVVSLLRPVAGGRYREEWFVPKECQQIVWDGLFCECKGAPWIPKK